MANQQEVTLHQAVGDRMLFVPDYQRPYAWEQKQLEDLWNDLDLLGPDGAHYAGTLVLREQKTDSGVVLTSMDDAGNVLRHTDVVDGQQRLITCLVLLDGLRRRFAELAVQGQKGVDKISEQLRTSYGLVEVEGLGVPKLRLGADLNIYWVDKVLGDQTYTGQLLSGHRRLAEAVVFFDKRLDELADGVSAEEHVSRLRDLLRRVSVGLKFLVYEVQSVAEVGVIFETLNERGRPLTELEKTKNYLLYLARQIKSGLGDSLADHINASWSDIFRNLSREAAGMDDQLLRAHWLATQDPDTRNWQRIASIKTRFDRRRYISGINKLAPSDAQTDDQAKAWQALYDDVEPYVSILRDCSSYLAESFDPQASFDEFGQAAEKVRKRSSALRRSGVVAIFRPLLLACRMAHPTDGALYADLVDVCERYAARVFVIAQRRANAGQSRLFRLSNDLYLGTDPQSVLTSLRVLLLEYADNARVSENVTSPSENWYVRRGHKYFLYEYELSLMKVGEVLLPLSHFTGGHQDQRTTEHILPQNPDPNDQCWWKEFTPEQHVAFRHSLGNLVLTLDNSSYGRKCFAEKRGTALAYGVPKSTCYAQGTLHQEQALAQYETWTPDTILQRQKVLAKWALERWHVEPPPPSVAISVVVAEADEGVVEYEGTDEDELVLIDSESAQEEITA